MEGQTVSSKKEAWSQFAIEEYRSLQAEALERVRSQNTFVGFALLIGTGVVSASPLWTNLSNLLTASIAFSFLLWIVILVFIEQEFQIALIGNYIRERVYPVIGVNNARSNLGWEMYRIGKISKSGIGVRLAITAKYAFLILPMIFVDLWWTPSVAPSLLQGITNRTGIIAGYYLLVILRYAVVVVALIKTVREYFHSPKLTLLSNTISKPS